MTKTLLDRAKSTPAQQARKNLFNQEELEALTVAWVNGEITLSQVRTVMRRDGSSLYGIMIVALRRAVSAGRIKLQ